MSKDDVDGKSHIYTIGEMSYIIFAMVLLSQIPVIDLKEIPAVLWSSAIDSESRCSYGFEVIGRVKHFHEITVGFLFSFFCDFSNL